MELVGSDAPADRSLRALLAALSPQLQPGRYVFATWNADAPPDAAACVASVREPEGLSVVVSEAMARDAGLAHDFVAAWITLRVHSDLAAIGLTAAVADALAAAGIACNVIAGTLHDHLFVPADRADAAMATLRALSAHHSRAA